MTDPVVEPAPPVMHSQSTSVKEKDLGLEKNPYENIEDDQA